MTVIVVNRLADLKAGDRLTSLDARIYRTPLLVTVSLEPIEPGRRAGGARVQNPEPASAD
jgi:hypothetical protein